MSALINTVIGIITTDCHAVV